MRGGAITSASSVDPVNRIISRHRDQRFAIYGEEFVRDRNFLREASRHVSLDLLNHRYIIYTLVDIGERNGKNKLFLGMGRLKRREDYYYYFFFLDILKNSCQYFYLFPCSINLVNMKIERLKLFQEH